MLIMESFVSNCLVSALSRYVVYCCTDASLCLLLCVYFFVFTSLCLPINNFLLAKNISFCFFNYIHVSCINVTVKYLLL